MLPNQENSPPSTVSHTPQPDTTIQQQPPSNLTGGGMKIIQPTGSVVGSPESMPNTVTPQAVVGDHLSPLDVNSINPPANISQTSPQTSSIYPESQTGLVSTNPISRASLEDESSKRKKHRRLIITIISLVVVLFGGVGGFLYWYLPQDHSIYSKLTTENYTQNGVNLSFSYPSIMQPDQAELTKLQNQYKNNSSASEYLVYDYQKGTPQRMAINAMSLKVDGILRYLNLTPAQLLAQIKAGSGSFVDALNKKNPQTFAALFNGCNGSMTNNSNQTIVTCYVSTGGYTIEQLVGADNNYQYNLTLVMPNSIWNSHQKVWQKVEKSFTY